MGKSLQKQENSSSNAHSHGHGHGGHGHSHGGHGGGKWELDWDAWDRRPELIESAENMATFVGNNCDVLPDGTVLDFGCGSGLLLRQLLSRKMLSKAVGADVEEGMLKVLRSRIEEEGLKGKVKVVLMNATDGSDVKALGTFDLVTCVYVLGHIRDVEVDAALDNICSAVKPGGFALIAEFDDISKQHEGNSKEDKFISDGGHAHTSVSLERLESAFSRNSLVVVKAEKINLTLFNSSTVANVVAAKRE